MPSSPKSIVCQKEKEQKRKEKNPTLITYKGGLNTPQFRDV